jgi:hypothetical protein
VAACSYGDTHAGTQGLALVETDAMGQALAVAFLSDSLARDPVRRFEQLFAKRAKWTLDDIRPYLAYGWRGRAHLRRTHGAR